MLAIAHICRDLVKTKSIRHIDISGPDKPTLLRLGCSLSEFADGRQDLSAFDIIFMTGNASWFPLLCQQLMETPRNARPLVVIRHDEPLPPPPGAGLPKPRLTWREYARILRRDPNATDCYTNYRFLKRLAQHSLPDLLIVS